MSTPNRLETHWKQIEPLVLAEWSRLNKSDLKFADCEFDRLVQLIKQRYDGPIETIKEANIRVKLLEMLAMLENE